MFLALTGLVICGRCREPHFRRVGAQVRHLSKPSGQVAKIKIKMKVNIVEDFHFSRQIHRVTNTKHSCISRDCIDMGCQIGRLDI